MRSQTTRLIAAARTEFRWFVRAGLIERSNEAWRDFLAGHVAMEDFYSARVRALRRSPAEPEPRPFC